LIVFKGWKTQLFLSTVKPNSQINQHKCNPDIAAFTAELENKLKNIGSESGKGMSVDELKIMLMPSFDQFIKNFHSKLPQEPKPVVQGPKKVEEQKTIVIETSKMNEERSIRINPLKQRFKFGNNIFMEGVFSKPNEGCKREVKRKTVEREDDDNDDFLKQSHHHHMNIGVFVPDT